MSIECTYAPSSDHTERIAFGDFSTLEEAWEQVDETEDVRCDASFDVNFSQYELTEAERDALNHVDYDNDEDLRLLYGLCAAPALGDNSTRFEMPWSPGQRAEGEASFILCPDHPDRETVEQRMQEAAEVDEARERGEIFGDGTYLVGNDIQPGYYVVESEEPFDGCYWERLDAAGNIIANNFINSGFRAEVHIDPGDYSFTSERCGQWELQ